MKAPANIAIGPATGADIPAVADVLATALRETEIAHWLSPWPELLPVTRG